MIFVLDTNVLWKVAGLVRLATAARRRGHSIEIPALVYAERVAQLRREKKASFDPAVIDAFLRTHQIRIAPFDQEVAERCAQSLSERYTSKERWHDARRDRCELRFRIEQTDAGRACPATVDWYLVASYMDVSFAFVTLDSESEFKGMDVISLDRAIQLAEEP